MYTVRVNTKSGNLFIYVCSHRDEMIFLIQTMDKSRNVINITVVNEYNYYMNPAIESWNTKKVICPTKEIREWNGGSE
jgi:hypothetical protein